MLADQEKQRGGGQPRPGSGRGLRRVQIKRGPGVVSAQSADVLGAGALDSSCAFTVHSLACSSVRSFLCSAQRPRWVVDAARDNRPRAVKVV